MSIGFITTMVTSKGTFREIMNEIETLADEYEVISITVNYKLIKKPDLKLVKVNILV